MSQIEQLCSFAADSQISVKKNFLKLLCDINENNGKVLASSNLAK